jgi:methylmalonyl-CoA/ethylmalonyl-CoA epimerase
MTAISHIDHIAIAVPSINEIRSFYEQGLGLVISHWEELSERGIRTAFITLDKTMIELIEPTRDDSEIASFLKKRGPGIHHIAFNSTDLHASEQRLRQHGCNLIYEEAQKGAHESLVNFVHPRSSGGVLLEILSTDLTLRSLSNNKE